MENTPFDDPVHTERLLERIGPIRNTHYGGFYDFVPDMAKADTAYTNIALPAHTDTTYFTDPAGLQAFHLLSHTSATDTPEGGQSLLVDGYRAAEILKSEEPQKFMTLAGQDVPWHASGNEGVAITPGRLFPVFDVGNLPGEHMVIRWNNDDRGGKHCRKVPFYNPVKVYSRAASTFSLLSQATSSNTISFKGNLRTHTNVNRPL